MKEQFKTYIYEWVKKNFGESEADDPSWNIDALAEELNKHFHQLYWLQELEYIKENVENYIQERGKYTLTEEQMYAVADKIRHSEWYCSIDSEDIEFYVKEELKKGEK